MSGFNLPPGCSVREIEDQQCSDTATCQHYTEDYEYEEVDWPGGFLRGTCDLCGAEIERGVFWYCTGGDEYIEDWRLAE